MNVLFLSPQFPPHWHLFCAALRRRGVTVLGIGDAPAEQLDESARTALTEYQHVPDMLDREAVRRAAAYFVWRHGRIDRVESMNEYWLDLEAFVRQSFDIEGPRPAPLSVQRSKSGMAEIFATAGLPHPPTQRISTGDSLRTFVATHGLPVVIKPDVGVGAAETFRVDDDVRLAQCIADPPQGAVVQAFVPGTIVTFDGLTDATGRIVFFTSFEYCAGVMDIVSEQRDVYYFAHREIPAALERMGRSAVAAFDLRARFFHLEFLVPAPGEFVALEMNLRPPGGFTTDLMNYACEIDVYDLWARVITEPGELAFDYARPFFAAHVARRHRYRYAYTHDEIVARLGDRLVWSRAMPPPFDVGMGDVLYVVRARDRRELDDAIDLVHRRA